jgi:hypothetical protein
MKGNVDLTEQGHFSEGWMQGGWRAKGVFRKRKPMETSKHFKDILKMGDDKPKTHSISSLAAKLFGIKLPPIIWNGDSITYGSQLMATNQWTTGTATVSTGVWISTALQ